MKIVGSAGDGLRLALVYQDVSFRPVAIWQGLAAHPRVASVEVFLEGLGPRAFTRDRAYESGRLRLWVAGDKAVGRRRFLSPYRLLVARRLAHAIRCADWDVLFVASQSVASVMAARAAICSRRPFVLFTHGPGRGQSSLGALAHSVRAWMARHASGHIPACYSSLGALLECGAGTLNLSIGYGTCCSFEDFGPDAPMGHLPRELTSEPTQGPAILYVGRFVAYKRPADVVLAFSRSHQCRHARLWMVGEGPQASALRELASTCGLNGRVVFAPFQSAPDLRAIYEAADVLVMPSEFETWGHVVQEAMLQGTPVIASAASGAGEWLLRDGATGWLHRPGDVGQLATLLDQALDSPLDRISMGARARQRALQHSPDALAGEWVRVACSAVASESAAVREDA